MRTTHPDQASARHRRRTAGTAAAAAIGLAAGGALIAAPTAAVAAPADSRPPVMIVLDASGSMNADDAPGPRIAAARTAANGLIAGLPADSKVGLQVFGTGTGNSDAEKAAGCRDITTVAPVGTLDQNNRARLTAAVNGITASGYTPIGNALKAAAAALPAEGRRSIVLVSDGEDTCAPPQPCEVARQLKEQGIDLTVHTIGFKVDATARSQLSCVAAATGGTYSDAGDASQLERTLTTSFARAAAPYRPQGTPVTGAVTVGADDPVLVPGQYLDRLPTAGSGEPRKKPRFYRVPQTPGVTTWASATIIGEPSALSDGLTLGVDLVGPDGQSCYGGDSYEFSMGGPTPAVVTAVTSAKPYDRNTWRGCDDPNRVWLKVFRGGNLSAAKNLPVEIQVRAEPPVANAGRLPQPFTDVSTPAVPKPATAATTVAGGADFNSSPTIGAGTAVGDSIAGAERRIFRVPVRWGQQLTARVDFTPPETGAAVSVGTRLTLQVYSPLRKELTGGGDAGSSSLAMNRPLTASMPAPARWTNRESTDTKVRDVAVDGYYYLVLSMDQLTDRDRPVQVPFTLTTQLTGKPEAGPSYQAARSTSGGKADQRAGAGTDSTATAGTSGTGATTTDGGPTASSAGPATPDPTALETSGATAVDGSQAETDTAASGSALATSAGDSGAAGPGAENRDTDTAAAVTSAGDGMPAWLWGVIAGVVVLGGGALATVLRGRGRGATRYGAQQSGGPGQLERRDGRNP